MKKIIEKMTAILISAAMIISTLQAIPVYADSTADSPKVAMIVAGATFDYFVYIAASARKEAEEQGISLDLMTAADVVEVSDLVSQVSGQDYDVLIVNGMDALVSSYQEAIDAGLRVILFDSIVQGAEVSAQVGSDNKELGKMAGEYAIEYLKEKNGDVSGKIIVLNAPSAESMNNRSLGFEEVFEEENVEIEEIAVSDVTAEGAQKKVDDLLIAAEEGSVDIIFGSNAGMALGALASVEVAGRNDIAVMGIDNEEGQLSALKGDIYKVTVAQDPVEIGKTVISAAVEAANGEEPGIISIPGELVDKENVDDYSEKQEEIYSELETYRP